MNHSKCPNNCLPSSHLRFVQVLHTVFLNTWAHIALQWGTTSGIVSVVVGHPTWLVNRSKVIHSYNKKYKMRVKNILRVWSFVGHVRVEQIFFNGWVKPKKSLDKPNKNNLALTEPSKNKLALLTEPKFYFSCGKKNDIGQAKQIFWLLPSITNCFDCGRAKQLYSYLRFLTSCLLY